MKEKEKIKETKTPDSYVLDTSAILTLWNDENGADTVEQILRSNAIIYVSFMSFMEGRYRLWKNVGKKESNDFTIYLDLLPIKRIDLNDSVFEKAIEIKATNSLSVCDSWIIATAIIKNSILVHKDPEFAQLKKKIKLKTLP